MKKKVIIWGLGGTLRSFLDKKGLCRDLDIVAFTDNNSSMWHKKYNGIQVIEPKEIQNIEYDYVVICSRYYEEIYRQLERQLSVENTKIISPDDFEKYIKHRVLEKYASAQDEEIQKVVSYLKCNSLNVYGNYENTRQLYVVCRDQNDHPYIIFENKRMYFPDTYTFIEMNGQQFVSDVLYEQKEGSPHKYIKSDYEIKENSVIVDAGVCEGNFALRYIDRAKKVYLIEPNDIWLQALELTFRPYQSKVIFCPKFLSRYNSINTITIDELVNEEIDFLKMDIEGAEIDALMGAKKTLQTSNANCAICSYHKQNDEENIRFLLESYGYKTSTSKGYMFFIYDENIMDTLDLRRGIVYGEKYHEKNQHSRPGIQC